MIRVLLVDDHQLVRDGLSRLIESAEDLTVVGAVADGLQAVTAAGDLRPDVVLMDLAMPISDGVEATRVIAADLPDVHVLVLTSFSDGPRIRAAIEAGAVGYLLKDSEPSVLLDGIRAVVRGESPLHPRVARALLTPAAPRGARPQDLTDREREVLELVTRGLANKQIAQLLQISERTVKAHLGSIFTRIGVTDRTSAAIWFERQQSPGANPAAPA
jgi:DNA-binding NarL/FixJ family response regulator